MVYELPIEIIVHILAMYLPAGISLEPVHMDNICCLENNITPKKKVRHFIPYQSKLLRLLFEFQHVPKTRESTCVFVGVSITIHSMYQDLVYLPTFG